MSDFDLQRKFPNLTPINSSPALFTLNGFGTGVYGRRDFDDETGTYVKTYCLCALFFPVFALRAYRVADAGGGAWYFIGREPLSLLAKMWNMLLVLGVAGAVGLGFWDAHRRSPEYVAAQQLAKADRLADKGEIIDAADIYATVARGFTSHTGEARDRLKSLLDEPLRSAKAEVAVELLRVAVNAQQHSHLFPDAEPLLQLGVELAERHAPTQPAAALQMLDAVAPLDPESAAIAAQRRNVLEAAVARDGADPQLASQLAVLYEADGELEKCEQLLAPHLSELGESEGARILGQLFARQGEFERSHALLEPYCRLRLEKLHAAEKHYAETLTATHERVVGQLEQGDGPGWLFEQYQRATADKKQEIVTEYINAQIKRDAACSAAERELIAAAEIVPVALELGVVTLRRGQNTTDPAQRQQELARAEKTFLAIQGVAGESDEFRLYLGQVYYWLGKHGEGRQLFDELLASSERDFETLSAVSHLLREVGAVSEARTLIEEAYVKAAADEERHAAAIGRSQLSVDLDDKVVWLRRSNTALPEVKASLAYTLGIQAMSNGDDDEATRQLQQAVAGYAGVPESSPTLNNGALACFSLFYLSGEPSRLDEGLRLIEKAVSLEPTNSLVVGNAGGLLVNVAIRDVVREHLDVRMLNRYIDQDVLSHLYRNAEERQPHIDQLREHPVFVRGMDYLDRQLVLAPRAPHAYRQLLLLRTFTRDVEGLQSLLNQIREADLDLADEDQNFADFRSGKNDDRIKEQFSASNQRLEQLAAEAKEQGQPQTLAVAACLLSKQLLVAAMIDDADNEGVVRWAEEAYAASPSSAARTNLLNALLFRVSRRTAAANPEFAEFVKLHHRLLDNSRIVVAALANDKMRDVLLADADMKRAVALVGENVESYPETCSPWWWASLAAAEPMMAQRVADAFAGDEVSRLERQIEGYLSPNSPSVVLDQFWQARMTGDDEQAQVAMEKLAELGVVLPHN